MSTETELALCQELKSSRTKLCYFIMAASGSAIGFAITQTKTAAFEQNHYIWLASMVLWALSFFCGIKFVSHLNAVTYKNIVYLQTDLTGFSSEQREELDSISKSGFSNAVAKHNKYLSFYGSAQLYLLLTGALVYVVWHVYKMLLLTSPT
ncbi:hypothetical protein [Vibrio vulnificus]|uniref:hypothetical protein n=1 Tax=Vibrio vulnificus TaxID=672 RepID=UPI00313440BC